MLTFDVQPGRGEQRQVRHFVPAGERRAGACELEIDLADRFANFARPLKHLIGVDKPFTVRVIVKGDDKLGGTLFDAEIAGQRTAISYLENVTVKKVSIRTEGVELKNVQIAPFKN